MRYLFFYRSGSDGFKVAHCFTHGGDVGKAAGEFFENVLKSHDLMLVDDAKDDLLTCVGVHTGGGDGGNAVV